ncbi:uncharacterized protein EAF01_005262 [Botrytis porri]|uniref:Uncharacterized protein n=1 Tax=Botrytis porri TaxID=87229 RepID=A0A4Z1KIE2_9HELO|nr:uncharacterized protein EAF01_005262 [Botrytis porri]KAF7907676.1 hypothetical protein EAF01_005262 [Botrytis porri]TGO85290.1 hypothetical protein BPOR_0412g00100 [Botrytis porri]
MTGKPEPTTIPEIKCHVPLNTCGKWECLKNSLLPTCRKCTTEVIIYQCAHLKVKKSHRCEGCRPSKNEYPSSRPMLLLKPHNENLYNTIVCANYLDHEERREKRKELISQQTLPVLFNSQPESHRRLNPDYPDNPDATFRRPTVKIQQGPILTPLPAYGDYRYTEGYPHGQPNPQYIPVPGSAIPPAWGQPLQPLIRGENQQRHAEWERERQREEARASRAADRKSFEEAARYESTLPRGKRRPRGH